VGRPQGGPRGLLALQATRHALTEHATEQQRDRHSRNLRHKQPERKPEGKRQGKLRGKLRGKRQGRNRPSITMRWQT